MSLFNLFSRQPNIDKLLAKKDIPGLIKALHTGMKEGSISSSLDDEKIRRDAAMALASIGEASIEPLLSALRKSPPHDCTTIIDLIVLTKSPRVVASLIDILKFEGAEGIYKEKFRIFRVKVLRIMCEENFVNVRMAYRSTPGLKPMLFKDMEFPLEYIQEFEVSVNYDGLRVDSHRLTGDSPYGSWVIYFHPELIEQFTSLGVTFSEDESLNDQFQRTVADICQTLRISPATFYQYVGLGRRAADGL